MAYLSAKTGGQLALRKISLSLYGAIQLEDLIIRDKNSDTLLFSHHLLVDLNLPALLNKEVRLNSLEVNKFTGHVSRNTSGFNFDFITNAFTSQHPDSIQAKQEDRKNWQFSIKILHLKDVFLTYHDQLSGTNANLHMGNLVTTIRNMDLSHKKIDIQSIRLDSSFVSLVQNTPLRADTTPGSSPDFDMKVSDVLISQVKTSYKNKIDQSSLEAQIGELRLHVTTMNLVKQQADLSKLLLSGSTLIYTQDTQPVSRPGKKVLTSTKSGANSWQLQLKALDLKNNLLAYTDNSAAPLAEGMDYRHLRLKDLNVNARNITASPEKVDMELTDMNFKERSGFQLLKFKSSIVYDKHHMLLSELDLQTSHSQLKGHLGVNYNSLQYVADSIGKTGVMLQLHHSSLAAADVLFFAADLARNAYFPKNKGEVIVMDGEVAGTVDHLSLKDLNVKIGSGTSAMVNGKLEYVLHPKRLYAQFTSFKITSSKQDILSLLPQTAIPQTLGLPEHFLAEGSFTGYLQNFNAKLKAETSFGNVTLEVIMEPHTLNKPGPYRLTIHTEKLDLGKLLKQPSLGSMTLESTLEGARWDLARWESKIKLEVTEAVLKGYSYKDISLSGVMTSKSFVGTAQANDPNLSFVFNGGVNFDLQHPAATFTLDLKEANLKALNLSKQKLQVSTYITSDIHDHFKNPIGKVDISKLLVIRENKKYMLDSLVIRSEEKDSLFDVSIRSEFLQADMAGDFAVSQLPDALLDQMNEYFKRQPAVPNKSTLLQKFKFTLDLTDPEILRGAMIPGLEKIDPFSIKGSYNSETMSLNVQAFIPQVIYSGVKLDSMKLTISSDRQHLGYQLHLAELSNPSLKFENLSLDGQLKDNGLGFQFSTRKDDSSQVLGIGGSLKSEAMKQYVLHLNQELILNAEAWNVDPSNSLTFTPTGLYANNLAISNGTSTLAVNSPEKSELAPLEVKFTDFDLATFSQLIENNKDLLRGLVNGQVTFEKQQGALAFKSDLRIRNLVFNAVPVGTITLKADNFESREKYALQLQIEGNGNDLLICGSYNTAEKPAAVDLEMNIHHLNLSSIEPFTFGQVTRMSGSMNGKVNLTGSIIKPSLSGELNFKESKFRPRLLNSYLTIHEGQLSFSDNKALMNNLVLYDSLSNKAILSGFADIHDLKAVVMDFQIKTDNFLALNTTWKDNSLYYGRIFLDSDIHLKGTVNAPTVDVKARLNKGSSLTYVKPEELVSKNESKGIVEFIDTLHRDSTAMVRRNDSLKTITTAKGIELYATINFDKTVQLKMMVDPESGDSLFVVGGGSLDFNLDRSGRSTLTGKYNISDGGYHLTISDIVKRDFKIEKGSSITWSGDVLDAYLDLSAIYTIKTSPIDLVQNEVAAMTEAEKNKYRNTLTFLVYLKMTGFISSPEITFDIQLSPDDKGALNGAVNTRLGTLRLDESELNKQVFALLTLQRFIGDNPLDNGDSGGGLSSASRSSASKVLTRQLSTLSNKYVKFVNLDLGVNSFEDYSSGQEEGRTQLQLGVSKQLLNDKVTVRVGGNVELEGEKAQQNNVSDMAGNLSVDYKLTHDGRYKLKAFRENEYENAIEGEITKTGMGVLYIRNYNTWKELLSKPAKLDKKLE